MGKTWLSFSTISNLNKCPQTWLNKMMELETIQYPYMKQGEEVHKIIEDHVLGIKEDERLEKLDIRLTQSEDMKFVNINKNYGFCGKIDAYDDKIILEIKTGNKLYWTPRQFADSMQWRCYGLLVPTAKEVYLFNTTFDLKESNLFYTEITQADRDKAREWILQAIGKIEKAEFNLPEKPPCYRCIYRESCHENILSSEE